MFSLLINAVILLLNYLVLILHLYMHCLSLRHYFHYLNIFTPQPLRAAGVLFSPMVSGWAGGQREKVCPGCISETVRCRKLILGRDIG